MLRNITQAIRQSDTLVEDVAGCAALAVLLFAGLHLPLL